MILFFQATSGSSNEAELASARDELFGLCRVILGVFKGIQPSLHHEPSCLALILKYYHVDRLDKVFGAVKGDHCDTFGTLLEVVQIITSFPLQENQTAWVDYFSITFFEENAFFPFLHSTVSPRRVEWIQSVSLQILLQLEQQVTNSVVFSAP